MYSGLAGTRSRLQFFFTAFTFFVHARFDCRSGIRLEPFYSLGIFLFASSCWRLSLLYGAELRVCPILLRGGIGRHRTSQPLPTKQKTKICRRSSSASEQYFRSEAFHSFFELEVVPSRCEEGGEHSLSARLEASEPVFPQAVRAQLLSSRG